MTDNPVTEDSAESPSAPAAEAASTPRPRLTTWKKIKILLILCFLFVLVGEVFLRYKYNLPIFGYVHHKVSLGASEYKLYNDHRYFDFEYQPDIEFGTLKTNSYGYQGGPIGPKGENVVRVFCFGASTTVGTPHMEYEYKYPHRLKEMLQERYPEKTIEVYVAAVVDYKLIQSFMQFSIKAMDLEPDLITIYHAANDMGYNNRFWKQWPYYSQYLIKPSYKLLGKQLATKFGWCRMAYMMYLNYGAGFSKESAINVTQDNLEEKIEHDLSDQEGPPRFREYLRNFVMLAQARGVEVCVGTFATAIREDLTPEETAFMGFMYGNWSVPGFARNLARYNEQVRKVAAEFDIPLADCEATIPHDIKYFVDSIHFSEAGYEQAAETFFQSIEGGNLECFR